MRNILKIFIFACLLFTAILIYFAYTSNLTAENDSPSKQQTILEELLKNSNTQEYSYEVIKAIPHDPHAFTEGLLIDDGYLYESTGLYTQSKLKKIKLAPESISQEYSLPPNYFAEGIAVLGNDLYQLSYNEKVGFVYDKNTFILKNAFKYNTQGWGLTTDGNQLIMSDGSNTLKFIDPQTFKITRNLPVTTLTHQSIYFLNELEYIHGKIFANVLPTEIIVIISPQSGIVEGWINIKALNPLPDCTSSDCTANGIAYDKTSDTLYITGKNWPKLFLIKLNPPFPQ